MKYVYLTYKRFFVFLVFSHVLFGAKAQEKSKLETLVDRAYSVIEGPASKPKKNYFYVVPIWAISPETGIKLGGSFGYVFKTGNTRHNLKNKLVSTPLADSRATGIELDSSQENSVFGGFIKPEKIIFLDSNMSWSNNDLEKLVLPRF